MNYAIRAIKQDGKWHGVFDDLERSFTLAMQAIGKYSPYGRQIIFGANLILAQDFEIPDNAIIFNLEQVDASRWIRGKYLDLLRDHEVWDYSEKNIEDFQKYGVFPLNLCRIGWMEQTIQKSSTQDIDVLFYGSLNRRRDKILNRLSASGLNAIAMNGLYGEVRDNYIARARLVLNIHYYDNGIAEAVRFSHLIGSGIQIVSESGADKQLDGLYSDCVTFTEYNDLVNTCWRVLDDPMAFKPIVPVELRQDLLLSEVV